MSRVQWGLVLASLGLVLAATSYFGNGNPTFLGIATGTQVGGLLTGAGVALLLISRKRAR